jgi:uncharacterized repeat protein (TIGR02543 family)
MRSGVRTPTRPTRWSTTAGCGRGVWEAVSKRLFDGTTIHWSPQSRTAIRALQRIHICRSDPSGTWQPTFARAVLYYDLNTYTGELRGERGSAVSDVTGSAVRAKITRRRPHRTGYRFGGWYKDAGLANAWTFGSDTVTAATTLYAKWNANTDTALLGGTLQQDVAEGIHEVRAETKREPRQLRNCTGEGIPGVHENTSYAGRIPAVRWQPTVRSC